MAAEREQTIEENPNEQTVQQSPNEQVEEATAPQHEKPEAADSSSSGAAGGCGSWVLGLVGVVLALVGSVVDIALQGLVSRRGGVVMLAAMSATRTSLSWAAGLFNFIFLGGMSLIGAALGEGNDLKAGRYARLSLAVALAIGLVGAVVLASCADGVLSLFDQEAVSEQAIGFFRLQASLFPLVLVMLALNGILLGFLYVHVAVLTTFVVGVVAVATAYPLYLATDLGLNAFAISSCVGTISGLTVSLAYLLRSPRREKFGLDLGLRGVNLTDARDLGGSLGCLAFRSFVVNTPCMLTVMLAIRLSPVHGAVFQLLESQSGLVDKVVGGFAMAINFLGSRLWAGRYYAAFWNLVLIFLLWICTPMAIVFSIVERVRGRDSLAKTFANDDEQAFFGAVMTDHIYTLYILIIVVRAYYAVFEQALIAMQELRGLALIQGISFVVYLCVTISGYAARDFSMLILGMLLFLVCRVAGAIWILGRKLNTHGPEWYKRGTTSDPEHALRLTIDDPAAAKIFGGREAEKPKGKAESEFVAV